MWRYSGQERPDYAETPGPGQESVWDYPRPPRLHPDRRRVEVFAGDDLLARSSGTYRVLETASPPTFYIPPGDVRLELLRAAPGRTVCEWKGTAVYWRRSRCRKNRVELSGTQAALRGDSRLVRLLPRRGGLFRGR